MRLIQSRPLLIACISLALTALLPAQADEVSMPAQSGGAAASAPVATPARGATMSKVEAQFGAPAERHGAVGNPPITRWDYATFSVFFEHDHVIHSVIH